MKCIYCGAEVKDGSFFCGTCGQPMIAAEAPDERSQKNQNKNRNKRIIIAAAVAAAVIIAAVAICFLFSGKGNNSQTAADGASDDAATEAESTSSSDSEFPAQNAETTTAKASNGILSEADIITLFTQANDLHVGWVCHGWKPQLDRNDIVTSNGNSYARIVSNEFRSVDELEDTLEKYFEADIYKDRLASYYIMKNGKLYGLTELGQGGDMTAEKLSLTINTQTADYCKFTVTSYYANNDIYSSVYELSYRDGRWIFTGEFNDDLSLYLDNDIPWTKAEQDTTIPQFTYNDTPQSSDDRYFFDSANKTITFDYLRSCTKDEITIIINEIYARHGYIFKDEELREYFNSQSWYNGTTTSMEEAASRFNSVEQKNVDTIYSYQKQMGWR